VRAQVVTPRASRRLNQARARKQGAFDIGKFFQTAAGFIKPAVVVIAIALLIVGYNAMANSRLFDLHNVTVSDASPALQTEVEQLVRRIVGTTKLLDVDLAAIKQKVETIPIVRSASVARVLPDGIFVRVIERRPAVLVRRMTGPQEGKLIWLDDDAVEIGEFSSLHLSTPAGETPQIPPIARGFAEGNRSQVAITEDRERIALYKKLEKDFSEGSKPLWNLLDEIELPSTKDVNLSLAHPPVMIHVGSEDFRRRFEWALTILQAIKQGDAELLTRYRMQDVERVIQNADSIKFLDATRPERVVVNFATPGAEKPSAKQDTKPKPVPKKK
jgi:hypothetical protein